MLKRKIEAHVVHTVRTTVDRENQRVFPIGIEVRGFDDPALDIEVVDRLVPDFLDLTERHVREHVGVHLCELPEVLRSVHIEGDDLDIQGWIIKPTNENQFVTGQLADAAVNRFV